MTSCSILEQQALTRSVSLAASSLLLLAPAAFTLMHGASALLAGNEVVDSHFFWALADSFVIASSAAVIGLLLGLPAGLALGLYRVPGRNLMAAVLALPLLLPGFLPAIGLHRLALSLEPQLARGLEGRIGCMIVASGPALGLVALAVLSACRALPGSAVDAVRIAGGERNVLAASARRVLGPALAASLLAAALGLVDAGPAQVLGLASAAGEIQLAFAQERSFAGAGARCLLMAAATLLLAAPIVGWLVRQRGVSLMPRAIVAVANDNAPVSGRAALPASVAVGWILLPLLGLALPMLQGIETSKAAEVLARTWFNTLVYALGSAALATVSAAFLVVIAGRSTQLQAMLLSLALAMLVLPPQASALGFLDLGSRAPAAWDPILRSRFTVCTCLALRTMPVALVLLLERWRTMPPSLALAGAVHGVGLLVFVHAVLLPFFARAMLTTFAMCALLACAQTDIVQLLHPPGTPSLPLAVLTVLANAREAVGTSLCLLQMGLAVVILACATRAGAGVR